MTKYIVFDRDGTLIKHVPYLCDPSKVELLPAVKQAIKILLDRNCKLFLHTNQSGVARGYFSLEDVNKCNMQMINLLGFGTTIFKEICVAPDFPANKISYRKPSTKFGIEIINKYKIDVKNMIYIGDSLSDIETGVNIGCKTIAVNTGLIPISDLILRNNNINNCKVSPSLLDAVKTIIK